MIMKKVINSLFVIIAAMITFAGCAKQEIDAPATSETKTVQFFAESIETKTAFGTPDGKTYPTLWTANDKSVKILLNLNEEVGADITSISDDFTKMAFNADVKIKEEGGSVAPYTFSVISPETAYLGKNDVRFAVTIPTTQTPTENSVDEAAQILYAVSESFDELPESVSLNFKHFTAYGKLSFVNLNIGDAIVTSVDVTSSVNFANRWNYYQEDGRFEENSGAKTVTIKTTTTENLWFACAPVGEMNGNTLTFTINTNKGPLSKKVTLGEKHKFEAGRIASMKVDMAGIEFDESKVYELVNDVAELTAGSEVIIVASGYNQALSTTQNGNNRGQASVTKSDDKSTITDPASAVQVITIEEGKLNGTLAFNVGAGYLYAASAGNNYLRTEATMTENSSWKVEIAEGKATIKAQGSNTRNWLRYNSTNSIFSCYGSGQSDVSIYKLQGTGSAPLPQLSVPTVTATLNADKTGIDVSWTAVENATSYVVSCAGQSDVTVSDATMYSYSELPAGSYIISVTAKADGYRSATGTSSEVVIPTPSTGDETEKEEVTAQLSFANKAQRTSFSTTQQVWEQNGITFTNDKASSSNNVADYANPVRLYANSKVTVSAPGKITKIVFDANSSSYATAMKNSIGTVSGATVTVSSDKVTVTFTSAVESFVVAKLTAQVRLDSITVTHEN